jgi:hypothetical protein
MNPCRCPARVGIALRKGFIRSSGEVKLRVPQVPFGRYGSGPNSADEPLRDTIAIYKNLPDPDPPEGLEDRLEDLLASGTWDKVFDDKAREQKTRTRKK